jgi:hypothetical protein
MNFLPYHLKWPYFVSLHMIKPIKNALQMAIINNHARNFNWQVIYESERVSFLSPNVQTLGTIHLWKMTRTSLHLWNRFFTFVNVTSQRWPPRLIKGFYFIIIMLCTSYSSSGLNSSTLHTTYFCLVYSINEWQLCWEIIWKKNGRWDWLLCSHSLNFFGK